MRIEQVAARLRAAGCVFAEAEAAVLVETSWGDDELLGELLRGRERGDPLEQLVGWVEFGGLRLNVGPGVFVPRQRSLLLAEVAARVVSSQEHPVLVEAYCGVAPIAATLAEVAPGIEVHASDVDPVALGLARGNLPEGSGIHRSDCLTGLPRALAGRVTLVVAVCPYVPESAVDLLPREAREHEPLSALAGGWDGLAEVRRLLDQAGPWLAPAGCVLVELNRGQVPGAAAFARDLGFATAVTQGIDGRTAVLLARS